MTLQKTILVYYNKALALDNLGNHTEAIKYYDKGLAIDPNNVRALTYKANALDELGLLSLLLLHREPDRQRAE